VILKINAFERCKMQSENYSLDIILSFYISSISAHYIISLWTTYIRIIIQIRHINILMYFENIDSSVIYKYRQSVSFDPFSQSRSRP